MASKLKTFEVVRTPKIKDATGAYCKRGETCQLTKDLAEHYHKLGYIRVQMDTLFNDTADNDDDDGSDGRADEATDLGGPIEPEPVAASSGSDEGKASSDAKADAGTGKAEVSSGRLANRRRKRVAS